MLILRHGVRRSEGKLCNRQIQHHVLQRLAQLLPASAAPIIVADSGFKVPFFCEVERLGWRWVGQVRGRDFVKLQRWRSCQRLFAQATTTPTCLGTGEWVRIGATHTLRAGAPARGKDARPRPLRASALEEEHAGRAQCPRALVSGGLDALCNRPAKRLVRVCRQRIQIELSFRVIENEPFGEGLGHRAYSRLFLARLLLTMEHGKAAAADLADAIGPLDQGVANNHDALLAE